MVSLVWVRYLVCLLFPVSPFFTALSLPSAVCGVGMYETGGTCLPCPANSNNTQPRSSECACFEGYYKAAGEPPEMECSRKSYLHVLL